MITLPMAEVAITPPLFPVVKSTILPKYFDPGPIGSLIHSYPRVQSTLTDSASASGFAIFSHLHFVALQLHIIGSSLETC